MAAGRRYKRFAGQSVNNAGYHNENWDRFFGGNELRDVAYESFADAIADIGTSEKTLYITTQHQITRKTMIPTNISVVVLRGGSFYRHAGATLYFENVTLEAGRFPIFTGPGLTAGRLRVAEIPPEWFRAAGTGGADDSIFIQDTIDYVNTNYTPNDEVPRPDIRLTQQYLCESGLILPPRTNLVGSRGLVPSAFNRAAPRLIFTGLGAGTRAITVYADVLLEGLAITGPGRAVAGSVGVYGGTETIVTALGTHTKIRSCYIEKFETNVQTAGYFNTFDNCDIADSNTCIHLCDRANQTVIVDCTIAPGNAVGQTGILVSGISDGVFIHDNDIESAYDGIVCTGGSGIIVHDNRFEIVNHTFVDIRGNNTATDEDLTVSIHDNFFYDVGANASAGGRSGILVQAGKVTIDENDIGRYSEYANATNIFGGGTFKLTATALGGTFNTNTLQITNTVLAGSETITWTATAVVIAVQSGVSTVAQVLAASVVGAPWATLSLFEAGTVTTLAATAMQDLPRHKSENTGLQYGINFGAAGILHSCLIGRNNLDCFQAIANINDEATKQKVTSRFTRTINYTWDLADDPGNNIEEYFQFPLPSGYSALYSFRQFRTFNLDALDAVPDQIGIGYLGAVNDRYAYLDNFQPSAETQNLVTYATDAEWTAAGTTFLAFLDSRMYLFRMEPGAAVSGRIVLTLVLDEFQY
jgi:hypothetical protein